MTRTIGIVVSRRRDWDDARELALAARAAGVEANIFVMDEAVVELAGDSQGRVMLADADCDVIACAQSAYDRGLDEEAVGALLGSQDDHAAIVNKADRVVALT